MSPTGPPPRDQIGALIDGTLGEGERLRLEGLLEANPAWFGEIEDVVGFDQFRGEYLQEAPEEITVQPRLLVDLIGKLKAGDFSPGAPPRVADCLDEAIGGDGSPGRIGDYEVEELLAQGGMGLVFKGRDPHLQRAVAIKVLSPSLASHPAAREQFLEEARAAAALDHPNVLPIYAVHPGRDVPYFVMPFIEGPTLAGLVKEGSALPALKVAEIGEKVGRALAAAHEAGLVHRDIKPANILLDEDGSRVLVADFGIASAAGERRRMISGTPDFMAPEQERGEAATPAADVYGLGKVLDDCAAPKRPAWLARLIARMVVAAPGERPSSQEVVDELRRRRVRRKAVPYLAGALLVAVGTFATIIATPPVAPQAEPFFVGGSKTGYMELADAIAAAPEGGEVSIGRDGRYPLVGVVIDKALSIRAADGVSAVLVHETPSAPMFTASAELELEGVDVFRDLPVRTATPFIRVEDTTLKLRRCTVVSGQLPGAFFERTAMIEVVDGARIDLEDSMVVSGWANAFNFLPGASGVGGGKTVHVTLRNCVLGVGFVGSSNGGAGEVRWQMENCSVGTRSLWIANPNFPLPEMHFDVRRSVLFTNSAMLWMPTKPGHWSSGAVRWSGEENVYSDNSGFLRFSLSRALGPAGKEPRGVGAWAAQAPVTEVGAATVPHAAVNYKLGDLDAIKRAGASWMRDVIGPKLVDLPGRGADIDRLPF